MTETNLQNSGQMENPPEPNKSADSIPVGDQGQLPPSGKRLALRNVKKQLTDEELTQSGTQKMLLEMLEEAETESENLKSYVTSFYEADKKAAILGEKINTEKSIEIFFGVGVGLGGAILGLAPFFWTKDTTYGVICFGIGVCLTIGACIGRAVKI